jgi:hypothetical protein
MKPSTANSSNKLRESLLRLLWRQWSALGVAGHVSGHGRSMIDPEALVLVSTVFARYDARLFDEMFDWLRCNGEWINVLRLTRLQAEHSLGDANVLGALAEHLIEDSVHLKWKALLKSKHPDSEPRPLFPHLALLNRIDEKFRSWGWLRAPLENRGMSRPPRPNQPATFMLKLRALFGRQSRAEVVAWLLTHDAGHPAQIARETGYFRGSVQNVLNELELSGQIQATRQGREKLFVARPDQWRFLLTWEQSEKAEFPRWLPWVSLFTLIRGVHDLVDESSFWEHSDDLQAIELNRVIAPHAARLANEGFTSSVANLTVGENIRPSIVGELRQMIAELED